jgi:inner membrane protein
MIWQNHIIIGASFAAVIDPVLVPVGVIGATAPDWLEWIIKPLYPSLRHRGATHVVLCWIAAIALFVLIDYHRIGLAFAIGGFSHVFADSLTISGVPFTPWSDARFHLFGGKLRTGNGGEYIAAGIVAVLCFAFVLYSPIKIGAAADKENGFIPFFYDWKGYYEDGLIDGAEWKKNRFNFF